LDFIVDYDGILRVRGLVFVFSVGNHGVISFWVLDGNGNVMGYGMWHSTMTPALNNGMPLPLRGDDMVWN
jgi:hypothetical protein